VRQVEGGQSAGKLAPLIGCHPAEFGLVDHLFILRPAARQPGLRPQVRNSRPDIATVSGSVR
jgi:hypothetical protein